MRPECKIVFAMLPVDLRTNSYILCWKIEDFPYKTFCPCLYCLSLEVDNIHKCLSGSICIFVTINFGFLHYGGCNNSLLCCRLGKCIFPSHASFMISHFEDWIPPGWHHMKADSGAEGFSFGKGLWGWEGVCVGVLKATVSISTADQYKELRSRKKIVCANYGCLLSL